MVRLLARVIGVGIETADMLVQEVLSRNMRDLVRRPPGLRPRRRGNRIICYYCGVNPLLKTLTNPDRNAGHHDLIRAAGIRIE
jgi:hypothetical protein